MLLDQGRLAEFDEPSTLLADSNSKFYALCKSAGKTEFAILKQLADDAATRRKEQSSEDDLYSKYQS